MFFVHPFDCVFIVSKTGKENQCHLPIKRLNINFSDDNIAGADFRLHTIPTGADDAIVILVSVLCRQFNEFVWESLIIQWRTSGSFAKNMNMMKALKRILSLRSIVLGLSNSFLMKDIHPFRNGEKSIYIAT